MSAPQPRKKAPAKKAAAKSPLPPFDDLDEAALTALAGTLDKTFDEFAVEKKLAKAVGDARQYSLLVHLIAHGAVAPQAGTVSVALRQMRHDPDVAVPNLVAWVGKLSKTSKSFWNSKSVSSSLLPDWDITMQELAAQALLRDPSGFVAAAAKWKQANLRLGAHFLLGVSGHAVPAEIAADVLQTIAAAEAGTPPFRPQFFFVKNGALTSWNLNSRDDARAVALHFGDAAAWDAALATAMLGGKWSRVRDVPAAVLAGLPLDAFMAILLAENRNPGDDPEALFAVLDARRDDLAAVADAARGLASETGAQRLLREVLLVWTLQRGLDRGVAPTEAQVRELRDIGQPQVYAASEPDVQRPLRAAYDAIFSALPREVALAIAADRQGSGKHGLVAILRSHLDPTLLQRAIASEGATSLITLGPRVLPALVEALLQTPPMWQVQRARGRVIVIGTDPASGREIFAVDSGQQVAISDGLRSVDTPWGTVADAIALAQAEAWLAAAHAQHAAKMQQRAASVAALDGQSFDTATGELGHAIHGILAAGSGPLDADERAAVDRLGPVVLQLGLAWGHPERTDKFLRRLGDDERQRVLQRAIEVAAKPQRAFAFAALMPRAGRVAFTRAMFQRSATVVHDEGFAAGLRAVGPEQVAEATAGIELDTATLQRLQRAFTPQQFEQFKNARRLAPRTWLEDFAAVVREHGGPSESLYVLETDDRAGVPSPRTASSWSVVGGRGLGIEAPLAADGDPMDHVLTLDLRELPSLASRYPGARAISWFTPSTAPDQYEGARIVAVGDDATPPVDGRPLHVFTVAVPSAVFTGGEAPPVQAARRLLWQRAGWCLGGPLGVQAEVDLDDFLMQLLDRIGLSFGDGAIYVAGSGRALFQAG
ncbi:hypothetical protein OV090_44415 [Nannocystis sp. RBIL2]|uniref:hypothetical protein n=1 Tax=Nannocystis sp. RBIL2 TaxID=2996788 RepID=UPI00226E18DF|nr:hypothetical protein [Nannocystis sp. RBIL2]MCY1071872.1 hypothetical protein [Nannocystis sp. RBIL2]